MDTNATIYVSTVFDDEDPRPSIGVVIRDVTSLVLWPEDGWPFTMLARDVVRALTNLLILGS